MMSGPGHDAHYTRETCVVEEVGRVHSHPTPISVAGVEGGREGGPIRPSVTMVVSSDH